MSDLETCANVAVLTAPIKPPTDAATRAKVAELGRTLAKATALQEAGKYREGLAIASAVAEEAKQIRYRPLEAAALGTLGSLQRWSGDFKAAEQTLNSAVVAAEAGRNDDIAVRAWISLIWVNFNRATYKQCHEAAKHALASIERVGGNERLLSNVLNVVGNAFIQQGQYEQALDHLHRALQLKEKVLGPAHPDVAVTLNNFGIALGREAKYDEALEYHRRSLEIMQQTLGPDHPKLAQPINNIGGIFERMGMLDEAMTYLQRALVLRERALGPNHSEIAASFDNIGIVQYRQGKYEQALTNCQRGLAMYEKVLGGDHPQLGTPLTNIGTILHHKGKHAEALQYYQRALAIRQKALGPDDETLWEPLNNIGDVLTLQRKYDLALPHYRRALAILEKVVGPNHPDLGFPLTGIGLAYLKLGAPEKALGPLGRALLLREAQPGNPTPLAITRFALAQAMRGSSGDSVRAFNLAELARDAFRRGGDSTKNELAEVEAWLARGSSSIQASLVNKR